MSRPKKPAEYEALGRTVAAIYESGYLDKKQMYKTSLIKGIVTGFGGVIGATIVVALLLWILSFFNSLGFIRPFVETIRNTIQQ